MEAADLVGRVVAEATAQVHVPRRKRRVSGVWRRGHDRRDDQLESPTSGESLLFVRLDFTDGTGVRFGSASDGHSLRLDAETLIGYDMAEAGRSEVRRLDQPSAQERLEEVVPLVDRHGMMFGLLLTTATTRLFVFNWGDELYAGSRLPDVVRRESGCSLPR